MQWWKSAYELININNECPCRKIQLCLRNSNLNRASFIRERESWQYSCLSFSSYHHWQQSWLWSSAWFCGHSALLSSVLEESEIKVTAFHVGSPKPTFKQSLPSNNTAFPQKPAESRELLHSSWYLDCSSRLWDSSPGTDGVSLELQLHTPSKMCQRGKHTPCLLLWCCGALKALKWGYLGW